MKRNSLFSMAGALAVAGGIMLSSATIAAEPVSLQLADAAQMAAVKERQELMKSIGGNMKTIADYLKESKGTAEEAKAAAANIGDLAMKIPVAFEMKASLEEMDAVGKNRGKPEIWSDWDDFKERAETLEEKSMAVVAAFDGGDMGAVQAAVGAMGKDACGSCHEEFRGPKVE